MNVAEARRLIGRRVRVTTTEATETVILRGVPTEDAVWCVEPEGSGYEHRLVGVTGVEDAPLVGACGHEGQRLFDGLCVNCSRAEAAQANRTGANAAKCDDCGRAGAFRNPRDTADAYRCVICHQVEGTLPGPDVARRAGHIACAGADTDDTRHTWVHVRRSRWQCRCGAKRFVKPVGWQDEKWW